MSNLYNFPSQFVYWQKIENHQEIKQNILQPILEHSEKLIDLMSVEDIKYCNRHKCKTNYFYNKDNFLINLFKKYEYENLIIWNPLDKLLEREDLNISNFPIQSFIGDVWYNIYSAGGYHSVHNHGYGKGFSGFYILDLNEENSTSFFNSENEMLEKTFDLDNVEEGTVVFFTRSLKHYVQPCLKNRITISFNIDSTIK